MRPIAARDRGLAPFEDVAEEMQRFTDARGLSTDDELWFVEHPSVYTLGLNADRAHLIAPGEIPVVQTDRGGQVTYHGPGQLVCYALLDVRRFGLTVRDLVQTLENAVIDTVAAYGVSAYPRRDAPGVYVDGRKLAAVGLRIRRHCCYHGIAINVDMDLEPFGRIRPCGMEGLEVTQLAELCGRDRVAAFRGDFETRLVDLLLARQSDAA